VTAYRERYEGREINTETGALIYKQRAILSPFTEKQQFSTCNENYLKNNGK